jgi:hypothetical protein
VRAGISDGVHTEIFPVRGDMELDGRDFILREKL